MNLKLVATIAGGSLLAAGSGYLASLRALSEPERPAADGYRERGHGAARAAGRPRATW